MIKPIHSQIQAHALSAEKLYGDDTTVPILAKAKAKTKTDADAGICGSQFQGGNSSTLETGVSAMRARTSASASAPAS